MAAELWAIALVAIASVLASLGAIFLKKGAAKQGISIRAALGNTPLVIGIFFYAASTITFIPALKGGELSVLYPLASMSYVWVSLLSPKMLGERMNKLKWMGVLTIIIGVSLIGMGS